MKGRQRHVEGLDRQRQLDGLEPDEPGALPSPTSPPRSRTGDLSKKISVERARRDPFELKNTMNYHAGRPARLVRLGGDCCASPRGCRHAEGKLGGQAVVKGLGGTWKDLTEQRQLDGLEPDLAGAATSPRSPPPSAQGDLSKKIDGRRARRDPPSSSEHHTREHHGRPAAVVRVQEVDSVAREVGADGKLGRSRRVVKRRRRHAWKDLRQRQSPWQLEPDVPGARPSAEDHRSSRAATSPRRSCRRRRSGDDPSSSGTP